MEIYRVDRGEKVYEQDGCTGTRLYEAAGCEYVHLAIETGGCIPEHSLPMAVSFFIVKGQGICRVGDAEFTAEAGAMLECPPDEPRGWRNELDEMLEVLVIKRVAG